jgi:hypothetical protein
VLSQSFDLLTKMVDRDYVDKGDPFYAAIVAMSSKLARRKAALFSGVMDEGDLFSGSVTAEDIRGLLD